MSQVRRDGRCQALFAQLLAVTRVDAPDDAAAPRAAALMAKSRTHGVARFLVPDLARRALRRRIEAPRGDGAPRSLAAPSDTQVERLAGPRGIVSPVRAAAVADAEGDGIWVVYGFSTVLKDARFGGFDYDRPPSWEGSCFRLLRAAHVTPTAVTVEDIQVDFWTTPDCDRALEHALFPAWTRFALALTAEGQPRLAAVEDSTNDGPLATWLELERTDGGWIETARSKEGNEAARVSYEQDPAAPDRPARPHALDYALAAPDQCVVHGNDDQLTLKRSAYGSGGGDALGHPGPALGGVHVARSAPGAPFSELVAAPGPIARRGDWRAWLDGEQVWVASYEAQVLRFFRSNDRAATFQLVGETPALDAGIPMAGVALAGGRQLVLARGPASHPISAWLVDEIARSVTYVDVAHVGGLVAAPSSQARWGLVRDGAGGAVVVGELRSAVARFMVTRRFDPTGTSVGTATVPAGALFWEARALSRTGTGVLIVPVQSGNAIVWRVSADLGATWQDSTLSLAHQEGVDMLHPPVTLPDGRVGLVDVLVDAFDRRHLTLVTTRDGLAWSSPRDLRPHGGAFQALFEIAVEPSGGLFLHACDGGWTAGTMHAGHLDGVVAATNDRQCDTRRCGSAPSRLGVRRVRRSAGRRRARVPGAQAPGPQPRRASSAATMAGRALHESGGHEGGSRGCGSRRSPTSRSRPGLRDGHPLTVRGGPSILAT